MFLGEHKALLSSNGASFDSSLLRGAVKLPFEHTGQLEIIHFVLKLNKDLQPHNETQLLTEVIFVEGLSS